VSIKYFPQDLNVSSIGLLVAAAAIVGFLITILFGLYFIFPGFIYQYVILEQFGEDSLGLSSNRAVIWLLDMPSIIAAVLFVIFLISDPAAIHGVSLLLALLLCSLWVYFPHTSKSWCSRKNVLNCFKVESENLRLAIRNSRWRWASAFPIALLSVFLAFIPWLFLWLLAEKYSQEVNDAGRVGIAILAMSALVLVSNHLIATAKKRWVLPVIFPTLLVGILLIPHQSDLIPHMVVRSLVFGDVRNATLQLDKQGCQIATQYALSVQNEHDKDVKVAANRVPMAKSDSNIVAQAEPQVCSLSSTTLLWRIGNEYFVDATGAELRFFPGDKAEADIRNENKEIRRPSKTNVKGNQNIASVPTFRSLKLSAKFTIPASHVLSWSVDYSPK
jgi:hypothetical protein